jgi:APA family basic amino acid/polyamine antiporter
MDKLKREMGIFGSVFLGLGSIVGTGVFVSIGIGAGIAGPSVVLSIVIGAVVATCNGLSSAQLAANHPVSGGTYEYGYRYLKPVLGFIAGWMFLVAKSASAATAALGFSGYLLQAVGASSNLLVPVALGAVVFMTAVVMGGIRRSVLVNTLIVSITLSTLLFFVISSLPLLQAERFTPFFDPQSGTSPFRAVLHTAALMFVAYTGYGRIATLGEEVRDPSNTIPRAIGITLVLTMVLYVAVASAGVGSVGAGFLAKAADQQAAPLEVAARSFPIGVAPSVLATGAVTAMLGVLLNLLLGLSRVLLAMGRRSDMPAALARLDHARTTPMVAVPVVGGLIMALTLIGKVRTTWSFSAFTVLIYYAITNAAALFIPDEGRLFPRWISVLGLLACLALAAFVEVRILLIGIGIIVAGIVWYTVVAARRRIQW